MKNEPKIEGFREWEREKGGKWMSIDFDRQNIVRTIRWFTWYLYKMKSMSKYTLLYWMFCGVCFALENAIEKIRLK